MPTSERLLIMAGSHKQASGFVAYKKLDTNSVYIITRQEQLCGFSIGTKYVIVGTFFTENPEAFNIVEYAKECGLIEVIGM